jgi:hypothetical protein
MMLSALGVSKMNFLISIPESGLSWRCNITKVHGNISIADGRVSKELCYEKAETLEDTQEAARLWRYNLVRKGSGLRCGDVGRGGVVVTIRIVLMVCKIMEEDSDGTSELEELFEGGR